MKNKTFKKLTVFMAAIALTATLSGCGTTGKLTEADLAKPVEKASARIIVERNSSVLYAAAAADVEINGQEIASLGLGGEAVADIPAGQTILTVSTPTGFGRYTITVETERGKTYRFMVSPRGAALGRDMLFGMIGSAVDASVSENSGYFQITPVQDK